MAKKLPPIPIESVGAGLEQSVKRLDLAPRLDEYGVWPIWREVVGRTIARNAQPEKIRNGTLFVKVSSPVWMQELQFMKEMIAEKLNQRLQNNAAVKNIFFMVGRIEETEPPVAAAEKAAGGGRKKFPPPGEIVIFAVQKKPENPAPFRKIFKKPPRPPSQKVKTPPGRL